MDKYNRILHFCSNTQCLQLAWFTVSSHLMDDAFFLKKTVIIRFIYLKKDLKTGNWCNVRICLDFFLIFDL